MSPLSLDDRADFDRWLQAGVMRSVHASLTPSMSPDERREWIEAGIRQAQSVNMYSREGMSRATTEEGIAYLLWLGIRHHHEEVKPDDIRKLLNDQAIENAMATWDLINTPADAKKKSSERTRRERKRRSR